MYVCSMRVTEDFDCIYLYGTARVTVMKDWAQLATPALVWGPMFHLSLPNYDSILDIIKQTVPFSVVQRYDCPDCSWSTGWLCWLCLSSTETSPSQSLRFSRWPSSDFTQSQTKWWKAFGLQREGHHQGRSKVQDHYFSWIWWFKRLQFTYFWCMKNSILPKFQFFYLIFQGNMAIFSGSTWC